MGIQLASKCPSFSFTDLLSDIAFTGSPAGIGSCRHAGDVAILRSPRKGGSLVPSPLVFRSGECRGWGILFTSTAIFISCPLMCKSWLVKPGAQEMLASDKRNVCVYCCSGELSWLTGMARPQVGLCAPMPPAMDFLCHCVADADFNMKPGTRDVSAVFCLLSGIVSAGSSFPCVVVLCSVTLVLPQCGGGGLLR